MRSIITQLYSGNATILSLDVRNSAMIYSLDRGEDIAFFEDLHNLYSQIIDSYQSELLVNDTVQGDGLLAVFKGEGGFSDAMAMINAFFQSFKMNIMTRYNVEVAPVACIGMGKVDCFTTNASKRGDEPLFIGNVVHDVVHTVRSLESWNYAVQNSKDSGFVIHNFNIV